MSKILYILWLACALLLLPSIHAQQIATATEFLDSVSETYGAVRDYTANITITRGNSVSRGALSFLSPNRIRIDFTVPQKQALVSDGKDLWIYLPAQGIVLQQSARGSSTAAGFASGAGLTLLKQNYSASFVSSPAPTLISGTNEQGTHLRLTWRSSSEYFRELIVAVSDTGYIRMIRGTTARNETIRFDFTDIRVNEGVPAARFDYNPPGSASLYTDFLFDK